MKKKNIPNKASFSQNKNLNYSNSSNKFNISMNILDSNNNNSKNISDIGKNIQTQKILQSSDNINELNLKTENLARNNTVHNSINADLYNFKSNSIQNVLNLNQSPINKLNSEDKTQNNEYNYNQNKRRQKIG